MEFVELNHLKSHEFFSRDIRVKSLIYPDLCGEKLLIFGDFIADFFLLGYYDKQWLDPEQLPLSRQNEKFMSKR